MTRHLGPTHPKRATVVKTKMCGRVSLGNQSNTLKKLHAGSRGEVSKRCAWFAERGGTELRAESPQPPAFPSKTTRVKLRPFRWHRLAVTAGSKEKTV